MKMDFEQLQIQNFMAIGLADYNLSERGLVLIQGENRDDSSQDSNGSGKSSLVEAIAFCLYGATSRGERTEEVINRKTGGTAAVMLTVNDDGQRYQIVRARSKSKMSLVLQAEAGPGIWTDISKGTSQETQKLIEQIIGASPEVFNAAIYAAQERMPDLPGLTDKQLKLLIEEAAGIQRIQAAYEEARNRMNITTGSLAVLQTHQTMLNRSLASSQSTLTFAQKEQSDWEVKHAADIEDALKKATEVKKLHDAEVIRNASIKSRIKGLEHAVNRAHAAIVDGTLEWREKEKILRTVAFDFEKQLTGEKKTLTFANKCYADSEARLKAVADLGGTPCGECGKTYCEEDLDARLKIAQGDLKNAQKGLDDAKASVYVVAGLAKRSAADLDNHLAVEPKFEAEAETEADCKKAIKELEAELLILGKLETSLKTEAANYKKLKTQTNPHDATVARSARECFDLKEELDELDAEITVTGNELKLLKEAVSVFGNAGVRAHILDSVTPFLNSRTNEYLSILTDSNISALWSTLVANKKGEIKEKFCIDVASKTGAASFRGLSGGEKRKVRLACSMALQDLVSSRATKPIRLYIADEIDHALDESGLERLMTILDAKAKERGTVLVISHNSLDSMIRNVITMVKEDGLARLEGGV